MILNEPRIEARPTMGPGEIRSGVARPRNSPSPQERDAAPEQKSAAGDPTGRLQVYALYANVTAYHNKPGDPLNGGERNFMGYKLRSGISAAGPPELAGLLVEVPDFNPKRETAAISEKMRRFLREQGYGGYFIIDDIGSWITFLQDGKPVAAREEWSLQELSTHSLSRGEAVVDLDIMVPDETLAGSYVNRKCLVRFFKGDVGEMRWVPSSSPPWKGKKPVFDSLERYRRYMALIGES